MGEQEKDEYGFTADDYDNSEAEAIREMNQEGHDPKDYALYPPKLSRSVRERQIKSMDEDERQRLIELHDLRMNKRLVDKQIADQSIQIINLKARLIDIKMTNKEILEDLDDCINRNKQLRRCITEIEASEARLAEIVRRSLELRIFVFENPKVVANGYYVDAKVALEKRPPS